MSLRVDQLGVRDVRKSQQHGELRLHFPSIVIPDRKGEAGDRGFLALLEAYLDLLDVALKRREQLDGRRDRRQTHGAGQHPRGDAPTQGVLEREVHRTRWRQEDPLQVPSLVSVHRIVWHVAPFCAGASWPARDAHCRRSLLISAVTVQT